MKTYESYKSIALPWLCKIPSHWNFLRNKNFMSESKNVVGEEWMTHTLLSLTLSGIIPRDVSSGKGKFPKDFNTYKIVQSGDIVLCLFDIDETPCTVGLSNINGMITGAYNVFHIANINPRFLQYYYLCLDNTKALKPLYTGLRKTIKTSIFLGTKMPVPPREEQDQIVRYLDWQVSKINKLIAAKKKQIALLRERHKVNIEQLITCGTHNEETQPTGNPWISIAPVSWQKLRHKNIFTEKKSIVGDNSHKYTLLSLTTNGIIIRDIASGKGKFPADFSTYQIVEPGDMVFCLFDVEETPRTVGLSYNHGMITGAYTVFQPHDALPQYLLYYFTVIDDEKGFKPIYSGLRKVVGKDVFARQSIFLPSISEQAEIVEQINKMLAEGLKIIDTFEREIDALHELRTRLISDVVTGQMDVRGIEVPDFEMVEDIDIDDTLHEDKIPEEAEEQEE